MGILWFVKASIGLDIQFLQVSSWSLGKKLEFLLKKYLVIFLHLTGLKKFKLGISKVNLFGKTIFYDTPYGLAGYQSMLARHRKMIKEEKLASVSTIVDIGANVGFFSLMTHDLFPNAQIFAVEPLKSAFGCLEKNIGKAFNLAISDKNGFEYIKEERSSAFSSIVETLENGAEQVTALTLDEFCRQNSIDTIDILKIDTESYEANVLKSAREVLKRTKYLHLEISIKGNNKYTFSQINSLLYSPDFNFQLINFRNFSDKSSGPIDVGDFFYKNETI